MSPVCSTIRKSWLLLLIFQSQLLCIRGACGPPPVMANTLQPEETSGVAGDTVVYRCNRTAGYYESPGKSNTITCQGDDTWSTLPEFCERACGVPEGLPFATVKPEDLEKDIFLPGTNVSYNCRLGYIRAPGTSIRITCLADYTWSTPSQFCVLRPCPHPGEPVNGEIDEAKDFLFGSQVTYKCNDGYHLVGRRPYRDCQADGTWSNQVPQCEVTICAAPEQPANGAYDPVKDEYNYLDAVSFRCNKDFHVIGVSTVSCTSNGSWSADSPTCKGVSCPDPGPLMNGRRESGFVGPYTLNSAVTFQCNDNFIMNGSRSIVCNVNSQWEPEIPKCLTKSCGDPGNVMHATRSSSDFSIGSRVSYTCQDGYLLTSSISYRECQADGTWSSADIICSVICPNLNVANSRLKSGMKNVYVQGDTVEFECERDFALHGSGSITCNNRGQWEPSPPTCDATSVTCQNPEVANSHVKSGSKSEYVPHDVLEFECEEGYDLTGSSNITCSSRGLWEPSPPECEKRDQGLSSGAIAGIIIGALAVVTGAVLLWCCLNQKSGKPKYETPNVQYTACNNA
ncbi:complement component receptor 1-like protein isoform X2 [Eleutherodactylus coqui]|uniref:complement component receptor 1-like protein isoform X2 n=1 Tax=Eleutherodactylus coqui TaxID=57060 RepID=UPI003462B0F5